MTTEKHEKILQAANHLAELLQASPEYAHYISAKKRLLQDPGNKRIFNELREKQYDLQEALDSEGELDEKDKFINDLLVSVSLNPVVNDYLNAEYNFGRILERLGEVFEDIFPYGDLEEEDDADEDLLEQLEYTDKQALSEVRYIN